MADKPTGFGPFDNIIITEPDPDRNVGWGNSGANEDPKGQGGARGNS